MRHFLLALGFVLLGSIGFASAQGPAVLVIDQPENSPPQLKADRPFNLIISVEGAPCMVEEAGKCRIRANHLEVR